MKIKNIYLFIFACGLTLAVICIVWFCYYSTNKDISNEVNLLSVSVIMGIAIGVLFAVSITFLPETKEKVDVRLHERVWVRLTDKGEDILREYCKEVVSRVTFMSVDQLISDHYYEQNIYHFDLWQLMYIFASNLYDNGNIAKVFEDNQILFIKPA